MNTTRNGSSNRRSRSVYYRAGIMVVITCICLVFNAAFGYVILSDSVDCPGIQQWVAGTDTLDVGEVFVAIELETGDNTLAYLNVAVDLDGTEDYAPYTGTGGLQEEWIIQNLPIHIIPDSVHYHGGFFALTDDSARTGSFSTDLWVSDSLLSSVSYGSGDLFIVLAMGVFDRDVFGPPSELGPSGSGKNRGIDPEDTGRADEAPQDVDVRLQAGGATRTLPAIKKQGPMECFITSVAMSMKWLAQQNPQMFGTPLPAINDLINAMKNTAEWQTHGIIRWGHLDEWKKTIFGDYNACVVVHEWNGTDDAFTWMKQEFDAGQDVEMSMGYRPGNNGHAVIMTGWIEKGGKKYVKAVDPLEPEKNNKQFDKSIKVTGTDVDYPSANGTYIREINAESPGDSTTAVGLSLFTATDYDSYVEVKWTTETEIDNAGFNLHRSISKEGELAQINEVLIPAQGTALEGATYSFTDYDVTNGVTYYYWLEDVDLSGQSTMHGSVSATPGLTSVEEGLQTITYSLQLAHAVSVGRTVSVAYGIPKNCHVDLRIYDATGRAVGELVDEMVEAGRHEITWNGDNVPSGVYFCRMNTDEYTAIKKIVLLK